MILNKASPKKKEKQLRKMIELLWSHSRITKAIDHHFFEGKVKQTFVEAERRNVQKETKI